MIRNGLVFGLAALHFFLLAPTANATLRTCPTTLKSHSVVIARDYVGLNIPLVHGILSINTERINLNPAHLAIGDVSCSQNREECLRLSDDRSTVASLVRHVDDYPLDQANYEIADCLVWVLIAFRDVVQNGRYAERNYVRFLSKLSH